MKLLTSEGHKRLKVAIAELQKRRPIVMAAIKESREQGDLSENAGYHISRAELKNIERRLQELQEILLSHPIAIHADTNAIAFGHYVKVLEVTQDKERIFHIVNEHERSLLESDVHENVTLLTSKSPVAQALMGRAVQDIIDIETHAGTRSYEILQIEQDYSKIG